MPSVALARCDLGAGTLAATQTLNETKEPGAKKHTLAFKPPKTEQGRRTIALPALTVTALRSHRARQAEQGLGIGKRFGDEVLVCSNVIDEPFYPHRVTEALWIS
jgi:hypothetical protein